MAPLKPKGPTTVKLLVPRQRTGPKIPRGPEMYAVKDRPAQGGPGEPPAAFLDPTLHGSASEWPIYWALAKAFNNPLDPRQGPYEGGPPDWAYQAYLMGGRSAYGGAVGDFEVFAGARGPGLILRVQSYRFHLAAGPEIATADDLQKAKISGENNVIDLFESDFLDLTPQELVVYIKQSIGMIQRQNPITAGTVNRTQ